MIKIGTDYSSFEVSTPGLIIDPPWEYDSKHPFIQYEQVTYSRWKEPEGLDWIFSQRNVQYLFLWTTNSKLIDVLRADHKQFVYKQCITWVKTTSKGNPTFGLGNNFRNCTEQLLLFVRKGCKPLRIAERNLIIAESGKRTCKPKEFELHLVSLLEEKGIDSTYVFSGPNVDCFRDTNLVCVDSCFNV